ncbi:MAG: hypothetical protein HOA66_09055 [Candidatus Marinimicrobia bacterium]|jgi:hypothetical protein|nr:hypothetical protein [Candidatus Neomarinimicrobiota bacterium]
MANYIILGIIIYIILFIILLYKQDSIKTDEKKVPPKPPQPKSPPFPPPKTTEPKPLGFGWGNFWIISSYLGGASFIGLFLFLDFILEDLENVILFRFLYLLAAALFISAAYSLQYRKSWAINFVYVIVIMNTVVGLVGIVIDETIIERLKDVVMIIISYCWYVYFAKRKEMFVH